MIPKTEAIVAKSRRYTRYKYDLCIVSGCLLLLAPCADEFGYRLSARVAKEAEMFFNISLIILRIQTVCLY